MSISIVMAYYNRKEQLDRTLNSIGKSKILDFELIIVDDASEEPLIYDNKKVKIIRIEPKDKWYYNPCIPYNIGLRASTGDIVIIQNPECYHIGDILSYVQDNIHDGLYLSFACYALNPKDTDMFHNGETLKLNNRMFRNPERNGWFNHSVYRPAGYHFCSAITRKDLNIIGGFDVKYAMGISYDDDDLIRRIRQKMKVSIIDDPYVLHQYHYPFSYAIKDMKKLHQRNKQIFNNEQ